MDWRPKEELKVKFAHGYKLLKDVPGYAAGRTVRWDGNAQRFRFRAISEWKHDNGDEGIYLDYDGPKFTVEQASDAAWFEPLGDLVDFIPAFPTSKALDEFIYLTPECRLVNDVDVCRAINALLNDKGFQDRLYGFYRTEYNAFHGLT